MTTKQRILAMIQRLADDTSIDVIIDKLYLIKEIEEGIREADAGLGMDHDEFMAELAAENEKIQNHLATPRAKKPQTNKKSHSSGRSKNRSGLR